MMKALTLEEMEQVNGGSVGWFRKMILCPAVTANKTIGLSLKMTQDMYASNQEERDYIADVWNTLNCIRAV